MRIKLIEIREGKIRLKIPDIRFYSGDKLEPAWAPIFYNPRMSVSRDISVALVEAYSLTSKRDKIRVCEPLSATGVRGLRYAAEVEAVEEVILNDRDRSAYELERENASLNGLEHKVSIYNRDARALLAEMAERGYKFDVIDIDPFGTPAPFVEAALTALKHGGMLCITATDLAPLFGVYPSACMRKYSAVPLRAEFSKEVGARILAAFVIREAAKLGLAARPIYTVLTQHALRQAFLVKRSKSEARRLVSQLGFARYCGRCLYRDMVRGLTCIRAECPSCGKPLRVAGPLWTGPLWDSEFSKLVEECYGRRDYMSAEGLKLVKTIRAEADKPALYTTVTALVKLSRSANEPSPARVVKVVENEGGEASLTHFDPKGIRSNLQPLELIKLLGLPLNVNGRARSGGI